MSYMKIFLEKSEKIRPGYLRSLKKANPQYEKVFLENINQVPKLFKDIYSVCNGTDRQVSNQIYFDFLPGFRLMPIEELIKIYKLQFKDIREYEVLVPFLADYSGCYYAYAKLSKRELIVFISDEGIEVIHNVTDDFWKTINAFYDEKVYFTDEDGYLSYDFEKEGVIGRKYNDGIEYWK